jgi:hypothetical protein
MRAEVYMRLVVLGLMACTQVSDGQKDKDKSAATEDSETLSSTSTSTSSETVTSTSDTDSTPSDTAGFMDTAAGTGTDTGVALVQKPDFLLWEMNATSPYANQQVSPRQELGKVSAWYFGHAT